MSASRPGRLAVAALFLAYLAFVAYGSLVPFELRSYTFDQALTSFAHIRYLQLGVGSRADWVANIVLYVPLALLGCAALGGMGTLSALRSLAVVLAVAAGCALAALGIEFTQIFFAPRTVSLNDLIAEGIGIALGVTAWTAGRGEIAALGDAFASGGRRSVVAALVAYALAYGLQSLFPFDFLISWQELSAKLGSGQLGWVTAGGDPGWVRAMARLLADGLGAAPLGVLAALAGRGGDRWRLFWLGSLLGLGLEGAQVLTASGVSKAVSVPARGLGMVAGGYLGELLIGRGIGPVASAIARAAPLAGVPFLVAVAAVAGWFSHPPVGLAEGWARWHEVRFLPFYYHYFVSEAVAMASALGYAGIYAVVGVAVWARRRAIAPGGGGAHRAALWAVGAAALIEAGKLFVPPKHPDPTNLLIAMAAAAAAYAAAVWFERAIAGGAGDAGAEAPDRAGAPHAAPVTAPAPARPRAGGRARPARPGALAATAPPHPFGLAAGTVAAVAAVAGLAAYPVAAPWLGLLLAAYGVLIRYRPGYSLLVVPLVLVAVDLSPWTGRLMIDELDLVVLVTLAVGGWSWYRREPDRWATALLPVAMFLLWLTWTLATARGLWPALGQPGELAASSHSPREAWLVGKGMLWALALVPLVRRLPLAPGESVKHLLHGVMAALVVLTVVVVCQRHVFVGLDNFDNPFRVTGTFASMHDGGAYIEAFVAFSFPVLAVWTLTRATRWGKAAGVAAAALTSYTMAVTFSRVGYAALGVGVLVVAVGTARRGGADARRRWLLLAAFAAAAAAVALPILSGGFAHYRLQRAAQDLDRRITHWRGALELMEDGAGAALAGMGFGRYPTRYLLAADPGRPPGNYGVRTEGGNHYLRLAGGEPVYLDQRVDITAGETYRLSVNLRAPFNPSSLKVAICEKALLYSFRCIWNELAARGGAAGWHTASVPIPAGDLGAGGPWPHRPVKLSLYNPRAQALIDVDDVSVRSAHGREALANGDFESGTDRWLLVTDQDLAWHIHQQALETYFAQGLLGLLAAIVLLAGTARVLVPALWRGDAQATALAGALASILTVGLLGSVVDTARGSMLFYLGLLAPAILCAARPRRPGSYPGLLYHGRRRERLEREREG